MFILVLLFTCLSCFFSFCLLRSSREIATTEMLLLLKIYNDVYSMLRDWQKSPAPQFFKSVSWTCTHFSLITLILNCCMFYSCLLISRACALILNNVHAAHPCAQDSDWEKDPFLGRPQRFPKMELINDHLDNDYLSVYKFYLSPLWTVGASENPLRTLSVWQESSLDLQSHFFIWNEE